MGSATCAQFLLLFGLIVGAEACSRCGSRTSEARVTRTPAATNGNAQSAQPSAIASAAPSDSTGAKQPPGCPTAIAPGPLPSIATKPIATASDVRQAFDDAVRGRAERIVLGVRNPWSPCECPTFSVEALGVDAIVPDGEGLYLIFPRPIVNGHKFADLGEFGLGRYQVLGRFSGRRIDAFEWSRLQNGAPVNVDEFEDKNAPLEKYPEFCVEAWCVVPDPDPDRWQISGERQKNAEKYHATLRRLLATGVPTCKFPTEPAFPPTK